MAKGNDPIGTIGNLVTYYLNGVKIVRSRPNYYKQTAGTKASARNFGLASKAVFTFLRQYKNSFPPDPTMRARLIGAITTFLGSTALQHIPATQNIPSLENFQCNREAEVSIAFKKILLVSHKNEKIKVEMKSFVPKQVFHAPAQTKSVSCRLLGVTMDIGSSPDTNDFVEELQFNYNDKQVAAQQFSFPIQPPDKYRKDPRLLLLIVMLSYQTEKGRQVPLKDNPVDIVWGGFLPK
jgi:hypothetical protein